MIHGSLSVPDPAQGSASAAPHKSISRKVKTNVHKSLFFIVHPPLPRS